MLVLHDDPLDVAFVDQLADLLDEVAAPHLNFFNKSLEIHILDYACGRRQVPPGRQNFFKYSSNADFCSSGRVVPKASPLWPMLLLPGCDVS